MIATAQQIIDSVSGEHCYQGLNDLARQVNQIIGSYNSFEVQTVAEVFHEAELRIDSVEWH